MRYSQGAVSKAENKWNEQFSDETLQWKTIYLTVFKSTNDIKLRNFQYKYIMCVVTTNQFLTKRNIVGSALCEFCSMEIKLFHFCSGNVLMYNSFGHQCQIFCECVIVI